MSEYRQGAVIDEIQQVPELLSYMQTPLDFYHLGTFDGKAIDLVIKMGSRYLLIKCHQGRCVTEKEFQHFGDADLILDKPILGCWVVSMDEEIKSMDCTLAIQ